MGDAIAGQKYYIKTSIPSNARMFTRAQIRPGEEIIAERPLDRIKIGLKDTYNPTQILDRVKKYNASSHLESKRERMSQGDRDAMDALFNQDPNGGICSLWATNGFEIEEIEDGQFYTSLLLFNDISRANHSCRPNAVFTWNDIRQVGTLYALDTIRNGAEIKIEYAANTEDCLRTGVARRRDILKAYSFDCRCGACFRQGDDGETRNRDDDMHRSRAAKLHKQIESDEVLDGESVAATALRKLELCYDYVGALNAMGIKDMKMASAWRSITMWQDAAFDTATRRTHLTNCDTCDGDHSRKEHLSKALEALNEENGIHIRCWGTRHPDLAEDDARRQAMQVKLNRYS